MKNFDADSFDFNKEYQNISKKINKPNILVCGATGVGKSSFVNDVFGKRVAAVGEGAPVTRGIKRYEDKDLSVVLYDSEGYEVGQEKQAYFKNEIIGTIGKLRSENLNDLSKHIHEVWYFISAANKRVTETDIEVINEIKKNNVPIAIVVTQIDNVDEEELTDICRTIENDFRNIKFFTVCVSDDDEIIEAIKPFNQKDLLIEWALHNLSDTLKDGFIASLNNNLELVRKTINKKIVPSYTASAVAAAAVPIPMADAALLTPIQLSMSVHIMKLYGINKISGAVTSVVNSVVLSQVGKLIAKTIVGNLVKLIPGFGTAAGIAINATVAGSLTSAIGYAISELCYKYSKAIVDGNPIDIASVFTSDAFKYAINEFYKKGEQYE